MLKPSLWLIPRLVTRLSPFHHHFKQKFMHVTAYETVTIKRLLELPAGSKVR